ncbi:hypothetical protein DM02DRAFT_527522 [Periconia macrospinosa]|uniref:NB-ARC domain-containing protein n=1 Tax=Periconia macrospinosa TaxID=97972 RepID=A0A2V1DQU3_9PLEO|nr:hypothetical protein DM02DRAFT_527522 [Periconia macrospinosa]
MRELERLLLDASPAARRRNVVVAHGFGGIGKTQLAVEFARSHQHRFTSIFWLDGSSEARLKQSFVEAMARLPQSELTGEGAEALKQSQPDTDVAVRECLQWLSLSSNPNWLLIFDNVDRDFHDKDDPQAYNVKNYFPHPDHGSILITSRLASLSRHGSGVKVGTVAAEQALAILENSAGKVVESKCIAIDRDTGFP